MIIGKIFLSLLLSVLIIPLAAFADSSISLDLNNSQYNVGDTLEISGTVSEKKMPVIALRIYDPDDVILSAHNLEINDDSTFSKHISLEHAFYDKSGKYTISADYGKEHTEIFFEIISTPQENSSIDEANSFSSESEDPKISSLQTDYDEYFDKDIIIISGSVSYVNEPSILVAIQDPFGSPTGFYFGNIDKNNNFSVSFPVQSGINFKVDGTYSVVAHYGSSKEKISFEYSETKSEQPKAETKSEQPKAETKSEQPKAETKSEQPKAETKSEQPKAETKSEQPKAETKSEQPKAETKSEQPKAETKSEQPKAETKSEQPKAETKSEQPKNHNNLSVEDIELGKILNDITLNCDDSTYTDIISYYDGMGPALFRLCKYSEAISFFDQSLANNPNNIEVLNNKGSALSKLGLYSDAIHYYDSALSINSNYYITLNNKANVLSTIGNYSEAMPIYNHALEVNPSNPIIKRNMELSIKQYSDVNVVVQSTEIPTMLPPLDKTMLMQNNETTKITENKEEKQSNLFVQIETVFSSLTDLFDIFP